MQPHAGVQVMIVGLAGHVRHGEVYCCTVGNGHCKGHREKEINVSTVRLSTIRCTMASSACVFRTGEKFRKIYFYLARFLFGFTTN